jgi:hypothetical protein
MIYAQADTEFEATTDPVPSGLVGTIGVQITDTPTGTVVTPRITSGIIESPAGSGLYAITLTAPSTAGTYSIIWDTGGSTPKYGREDLVVTTGFPSAVVPSGPHYASEADVVAYIEGFVVDDSAALNRCILRAERMIDQNLPPVEELTSLGLKYDVEDLTTSERTALTNATCAQVEYLLYLGPEAFVEQRIHEGDLKTSAVIRPRRLAPKALQELYTNGFIKRTGRMT